MGSAALVVIVKGSEVLIPLAISVMLWYLLNALAGELKRFVPGGRRLPDLAWIALALAIILLVSAVTMNLLLASLKGLDAAVPAYQKNIQTLIRHFAGYFGAEESVGLDGLLARIDLKWAVTTVAGLAATIAGEVGLILVYVLFLVLEQKSFDRKVKLLVKDPEKLKRMTLLLGRMQESIRAYLLIKTLMCVLVGVLTFALLAAMGVDYAFFLAFVGFITYYIPTVGSVAGVFLPTLLAALQFSDSAHWLFAGGVLTAVHMVVGNVLEPRLMGGKLNISPFVVMLSLVVWGKIWGVAGMVLCVPLTIIAMIALAHFPATRPLALLLSEDGELEVTDPGQAGE